MIRLLNIMIISIGLLLQQGNAVGGKSFMRKQACSRGSLYAGKRGLVKNSFKPKLQSEVISKTGYSINFMWINKNLEVGKAHRLVFPETIEALHTWKDVISAWAKLHPNAIINIWYDSTKTTKKAIAQTAKLVFRFNRFYNGAAHIQLRDVQSLTLVRENPFICSENLPVYYRADLLRLIATYEDLKNEKTAYFVYADMDMQPMLYLQVLSSDCAELPVLYDLDTKVVKTRVVESPSHGEGLIRAIPFTYSVLFSPTTLENLETIGFVVRRGGYLGFENSFHIASDVRNGMLAAIKTILIDLNVQRAKSFLDGKSSGDLNPETIYTLYPLMCMYYLHQMSFINLMINPYEIDTGDGFIDDSDDDSLVLFDHDDTSIKNIPYEESLGLSCFPTGYLKVGDGYEFQLTQNGKQYFDSIGKTSVSHEDLYSLLPRKITPYHHVRNNYS